MSNPQDSGPRPVVFLGGLFLPERIDDIQRQSRGPVQFAADALQKAFLRGFATASDTPLSVVNLPFVGSYPARLQGLAYAMWHTLTRTRQAYMLLLEEDGLWGRWKTRLALKGLMIRIAAACGPRILESLLPWHDPNRVPDPAWIQEWVALYERGEEGLTRLDTRRMHLGPAAMVG